VCFKKFKKGKGGERGKKSRGGEERGREGEGLHHDYWGMDAPAAHDHDISYYLTSE